MELRFAVLVLNTFVFTVVVITSQPEAAHLKILKQEGGELSWNVVFLGKIWLFLLFPSELFEK